jgi:hypothetical protein
MTSHHITAGRVSKRPPPGYVWEPEAAVIIREPRNILKSMRLDPRQAAVRPPYILVDAWRAAYPLSGLEAYVKAKADKLRARAAAKEEHARASIMTAIENADSGDVS